MPKIVTVDQMRAIEQAADAGGHSYAAMMAHAGRAVADRVIELLYGAPEPTIAIIVGPGNNGGDGLVVGALLMQELDDAQVTAYMLKPRDKDDQEYAAAVMAGVTIINAPNGDDHAELHNLIAHADVVIDALFGTSLHLPIEGNAAKILQTVDEILAARRDARPPTSYTTPSAPPFPTETAPLVIAVDCPSGLACDTGALDENTIHADETVTFAAAKPGLLKFPGAKAVGMLHIGAIGLPPDLPALNDITLTLVDALTVVDLLPERALDAHKGTAGRALVVAGSLNYIGAAYLSAASAYRIGAGWVTVGAPTPIIPTLAGMLPEATWALLPHDMGVINEHAVKALREEQAGHSAMLVGPGLGQEDTTGDFLCELLQPQEEIRQSRAIGFVPATSAEEAQAAQDESGLPPLVIDASGLWLLSEIEDWAALVPPHTILTPHPGEFAQLAGIDTADVQADRVRLAQRKAAAWHCIVVLKGAFTVIAAPDGRTAVLPFATPALASAGTGDVLAGAITGLLAQGLAPYDAAIAGAYLHGLAGVRAGEHNGVLSATAGDVLDMLPDALSQIMLARG
ncbi:MAG: NAD(P)H-hydrate dehydratase [Anaerolineae bacterium]|nr:NAD(P)H-hydrate dehydratase [Anaerolineae bacterium]